MRPEITVLMSVYNGEKFLNEAIESILNQTYEKFKFLIINDASTDKSREIILSYDDPRIQLIDNENNIGLTRSLNKGLGLAKEKYIARIDADDISLPTRLEKEVEFLEKNINVGLVGTYCHVINEKGKVLYSLGDLFDNRELKVELMKRNKFAHGSVMFRKDCLEKVGFYREEFISAQDYDLWLRISESFEIANIPEILYKWRINTRSISVNNKVQQNKYSLLSIEMANERLLFGKDRIQIQKEQKTDDSSNNLVSERVIQTRRDKAYSYYYFSRKLVNGKEYWSAMRFSLISIINDFLNIRYWIQLSNIIALLLLPVPIKNLLRYLRRKLSSS